MIQSYNLVYKFQLAMLFWGQRLKSFYMKCTIYLWPVDRCKLEIARKAACCVSQRGHILYSRTCSCLTVVKHMKCICSSATVHCGRHSVRLLLMRPLRHVMWTVAAAQQMKHRNGRRRRRNQPQVHRGRPQLKMLLLLTWVTATDTDISCASTSTTVYIIQCWI